MAISPETFPSLVSFLSLSRRARLITSLDFIKCSLKTTKKNKMLAAAGDDEEFILDVLCDELNFDETLAREIVNVNGVGIRKFGISPYSFIKTLITTITETIKDDTTVPPTKFFIPADQRDILYMLTDYAHYVNLVNRPHESEMCTLENLEKIRAYFNNITLDRDKGVEVKTAPEKFDNKDSRGFMERMNHWLRSNYGRGFAPLLAYVRDDPYYGPDPGFLEPSAVEEIMRSVSLTGDDFNHNNSLIWNMIFQMTHGTTAWDCVKQYASRLNGRGAYLALVSQYQGVGNMSRIVDNANIAINSLSWGGARRNFTWEVFTNRLAGAFADLEEAGQGYTEQKKVQTLLEKCAKAKELDATCGYIHKDAALKNNYILARDYLGAEVKRQESVELLSNRNQNRLTREGRRVYSVEARAGRGRQGNSGRGGRGRGRDSGRGRGRGGRYGGRGRGGRGRGRSEMSEDGTIVLNSGGYPPHIWNNRMTSRDHHRVYQFREEEDREQDSRRRPGRGVSAIERDRDTRATDQDQEEEPAAEQERNQDMRMTRRREGGRR